MEHAILICIEKFFCSFQGYMTTFVQKQQILQDILRLLRFNFSYTYMESHPCAYCVFMTLSIFLCSSIRDIMYDARIDIKNSFYILNMNSLKHSFKEIMKNRSLKRGLGAQT